MKVKLGDSEYDEYWEVVYNLLGDLEPSAWELYDDSLEGVLERVLSRSETDVVGAETAA